MMFILYVNLFISILLVKIIYFKIAIIKVDQLIQSEIWLLKQLNFMFILINNLSLK